VQFGRWLNQVLPLGFRLSDQVTFTDPQTSAARQILDPLPISQVQRYRRRLMKLTLDIAAYESASPADTARRLRDALQDPVGAMALFDQLGLTLDESIATGLRSDIQARLDKRGVVAGQNKLIEELAVELSGVARVRFDQLAFKQPDLGRTLNGRKVLDRLSDSVPITVLLNAITIPIIYLVAIFTGVYAARHRGSWFDVGSGFLFIALWSVPVIWAGVMLVTYLANTDYVRWFPEFGLHDLRADQMPLFPRWTDEGFLRGWLLDAIWHLVLPIVCLTYGGFAVMSRVMRGAMLDNLSANFVRTARAKGLPEHVVLWRHTFRNGILPLITMAAAILPALFVGSVVVEKIFSINGMGRLAIDAAVEKDRDLVMATTLVAGMLGLLSELVRDICYAIADPRVSYD
jgi:peptide/nickel transport system permease protein